MTFLNPLDALIPKIPFSFFPDFWVRVTSEARGSVSVGFWGSCQLSPFGRGPAGGLYRPPPPRKRKPGLPMRGVCGWEGFGGHLASNAPFLYSHTLSSHNIMHFEPRGEGLLLGWRITNTGSRWRISGCVDWVFFAIPCAEAPGQGALFRRGCTTSSGFGCGAGCGKGPGTGSRRGFGAGPGSLLAVGEAQVVAPALVQA